MPIIRQFVFVLAIALASAHAWAGNCSDELAPLIYRVHISKLRPTQMEFGEALVRARAIELLHEAAELGLRPLEYVIQYRNREIPGVVSPRGEFFVTDTHHGISTIYRMLGKRADVKLKFRVERDYRTPKPDGSLWTYEEFIFNLQAPVEDGGLGKGQFSKAVKHKSPEARFAYLPARFDKLQNNPVRTLVGAAFKLRGHKPENYVDYIEFEVADRLDPNDIGDLNFTPENVARVADLVFSDDEMMRFLADHLR